MKNIIAFIFFYFVVSICIGQDETKWKLITSFPADTNSVWNIDGIGNVYTTNKDVINKFDSTGTLKFNQSIKMFGKLSSIFPINTMKIGVFSEQQQLLCFLDNTLTKSEDCIELSKHEIDFATLISNSAQPDKFWIFDQLNSRLHLISHDRKSQNQEIKNVNGLLDLNKISSITEQNYHLYLIDSEKGVYELDLYGSLIEFYPMKEIISVYADDKSVLLFSYSEIIVINKQTQKTLYQTLPDFEFTDVKYVNKNFYFKSKDAILKYRIEN